MRKQTLSEGTEAARAGRDVLVVRESRGQRDGLFGFVCVALAAVVVRVVTGSHLASATGVVMTAVFSALLVFFAVIWFLVRRNAGRIEVSTERIHYVTAARVTAARAKEDFPDLVRAEGDAVQFATRSGGGQYRYNTLIMSQSGTSRSWTLPFFNQKAIAAACTQRGWRVDS